MCWILFYIHIQCTYQKPTMDTRLQPKNAKVNCRNKNVAATPLVVAD